MQLQSLRMAVALVTLVATTPAVAPRAAAAQNPITAARDAFRKAQEAAKRKAQEEAQRRQQQDSQSQPVPSAATPAQGAPVVQTGAAPTEVGTPDSTARLADSLGWTDIAGLKLGMPTSAVEAVLRSINPKLEIRPVIEAIWPIDRSNTGAPIPPTAPRSTTAIAASHVEPGQGSEAIQIQAAGHPNPAVVIKIDRTVNYDEGTGPGFDNIVEGLRKKYGPESIIKAEMSTGFNKSLALRWFVDERGQALRGNLVAPLKDVCDPHPSPVPGLCGTLTVIDAAVQAGGSGIVRSISVTVGNSPLLKSAREATEAYLRQVDEDRAKRQQIESSQRATPKL